MTGDSRARLDAAKARPSLTPLPRIALFTLESAASAEAVLRFAEACGDRLVLVGLSDPYRPSAGGMVGQTLKHLRRAGPAFLPYLFVNFTLPRLAAMARAPFGASRGIEGLAARLGIRALVVKDVNGPTCCSAIRKAGADLIVSFHFDQIFTPSTLVCAPLGGVNVHPSLLPRHRGPVPTFWALQEGPNATGVSVHRLDARIDAGAVLAQLAVPLPDGASATLAARDLHLAGVPLLLDLLSRGLPPGHAAAEGAQLPYCGFPTAKQIRAAAKGGTVLVRAGDWWTAWSAPVGG